MGAAHAPMQQSMRRRRWCRNNTMITAEYAVAWCNLATSRLAVRPDACRCRARGHVRRRTSHVVPINCLKVKLAGSPEMIWQVCAPAPLVPRLDALLSEEAAGWAGRGGPRCREGGRGGVGVGGGGGWCCGGRREERAAGSRTMQPFMHTCVYTCGIIYITESALLHSQRAAAAEG
jgi:hypothetical protein